MSQPNKFKIWIDQFRGNFLLLAVVLVLLGSALAYKHDLANEVTFSIVNALLMLIGNVLAHSSVNLFNEYFDYKTKIDFHTTRTPFSGGTGLMVQGVTTPKGVLTAAVLTLLISLIIGIYFVFVSHWFLLVLIAVGVISIVLYNLVLAKILMGEFFAGLALGTFVVLGTYIGLTATPDMPVSNLLPLSVILISIPPGILTALLLFLNEFPDADVDKEGGRFHIVNWLGRKTSAYLYCLGLLATYVMILLTPMLSFSTYFVYIGLLTLPLAIKAGTSALKFNSETEKLIPAMGINVLIVLVTDLLLAIGVMI